MKVARISVFALTVVLSGSAHAASKYEHTMDGKTRVWHNAPQQHVRPSWSGERDENGYASGRGTLTWFRAERSWLTGSLLPTTRYIQVSQYTGKMVEGKLEGQVVSVDANGNSFHAKFVDGRKKGEWISGGLPTSQKPAEEQIAESKVAEARPQPSIAPAEPPPPAEAPPPPPKLDQHVAAQPSVTSEPPAKSEAPAKSEPPVSESKQAAAPTAESSPRSADSVQSLAMPPSSLRMASLKESTKETSTSPPDDNDETNAAASTQTEAPATASNSPKDDDARAVAALDSEYQAAVKTNDAATMDRILADDFVMVRGGGKLTKEDLLKKAREKHAKYERHEAEEGSQNVRVWRDTAVVTETLWVKGSENGKSVDEKTSVTETFVRTPNGWRFVSGQATSPAP